MKRLFIILPILFSFIACNQKKSNNGIELTTQDSISVSSDTLVSNEEDDGYDNTDMCYQQQLEEIESYKEALGKRVGSYSDSSICFTTEDGLNGCIVRQSRCHEGESHNMDISFSGFETPDWKSIDFLKTLFLGQIKVLPGEFAANAFKKLSDDELSPSRGNDRVWSGKMTSNESAYLIIRFDNDTSAVFSYGVEIPKE